MANLFTRHNNDMNETMLFNKSNADYSNLVLNANVAENSSACYNNIGSVNAQSQMSRPMTQEGMLDLGMKADIETKLQNRHKELNSNERTNKDYINFVNNQPSECNTNETMTNEDTRFTNPIANYREMNTSEYIFNPYLFINYQQAVVDNTSFLPPTRNGTSSRFDSKKTKFNLKPKEFITSKSDSEKLDVYKNLLPKKQTVTPAYNYTQ